MEIEAVDRENIQARIRAFLQGTLEKQGKSVNLKADDSLGQIGLIDSLFMIDLILFLESEFDLNLSGSDLNRLDVDTVRMIEKLVCSKGVKAPARDA